MRRENDTFAVEFASSAASRPARLDPLFPNRSRKDFISGRDRARSPRAARLSLSPAGKAGSRFEKRPSEIASAYSGRHYRETAASSSAVWPFTAVLLSFAQLSRGVR